jgi:GxxExxY protein
MRSHIFAVLAISCSKYSPVVEPLTDPELSGRLLLKRGYVEMHPKYPRANQLSERLIGAAIEVHRRLGPGLIESIYERCLMRELELREIVAIRQSEVKIEYKGFVFTEELRFDVLVESSVLIEVKAVQEVHPIHKAQLLSYMKLLDVPLGFVMNFHELRLVDGISRMILRDAAA